MKKNIKKLVKRITTTALITIFTTTAFTACGDNGSSKDGVKTVTVGVANNMGAFSNLDDDGNLDGYEVAVMKAVDEKLEDYKFEFQSSDFDNILLSLTTGKIDIGLNAFEYSDERAETYLFSNEGYCDFSTYFMVPVDSDVEPTWEGLIGKVVTDISDTDNAALTIQKYNKENPDKAIKLDYYGNVTTEVVVQGLLEGRWDAGIAVGQFGLAQYNAFSENGEPLFKIGEAIDQSLAYPLYPKDGKHEKLRDEVDEAIAELREDGTLSELSIKYFGFDISTKELADDLLK
jgi:L-cystine transport system substrate-binding protein